MSWIQTFTGRQFWLLEPDPSDVCIEDIAHALSLQCRFNGHVKRFYSVADHSIRVSRIVPPEMALVGLMHDAAEAYIGDMVKPLKMEMGRFQEVEVEVWRAIALAFDLPLKIPPEVKHADLVMLATEARDLLGPKPAGWMPMPEPLPDVIEPLGPMRSEDLFTIQFEILMRGRGR